MSRHLPTVLLSALVLATLLACGLVAREPAQAGPFSVLGLAGLGLVSARWERLRERSAASLP